jgi:hypothetical protein
VEKLACFMFNSKKNSNKMTLLYSILLIPVSRSTCFGRKSPIIRSSIKLYLQHLVFINRVWPAVVVDESYSTSELCVSVFGIFFGGGAQQPPNGPGPNSRAF